MVLVVDVVVLVVVVVVLVVVVVAGGVPAGSGTHATSTVSRVAAIANAPVVKRRVITSPPLHRFAVVPVAGP